MRVIYLFERPTEASETVHQLRIDVTLVFVLLEEGAEPYSSPIEGGDCEKNSEFMT